MSRSRSFASLASNVDSTGTILPAGISASVDLDGIDVYDSASLLPISGLTAGNQALVDDRLYITNGTGWYNVALINLSPSIDSGPDGVEYDLDSTNTISISLVASDSDGTPITWSFTTSDSATELATITNDSDGSFNVTGKSLADILSAGYDSDGGSFTVTFRASDGISFDTDSASFTLTYVVGPTTRSTLWTANSVSVSYDSKSFSVGSQETNPYGLSFSPDGTRMYVIGTSGDDINQYSLSTAWDVSTASFVNNSISTATQNALNSCLAISDDGSYAYIGGASSDKITQWEMTTPWDVSTLTYVRQSISLNSYENVMTGLYFSPDGTKMFITGTSNKSVIRFDLSTAWDVSSLSHTATTSLSGLLQFQGLYFNNDGTQMFTVESYYDRLMGWDVLTPWDITNLDYMSYVSVTTEVPVPTDLFISEDGSKMYIVGRSTDEVHQYSMDLS